MVTGGPHTAPVVEVVTVAVEVKVVVAGVTVVEDMSVEVLVIV